MTRRALRVWTAAISIALAACDEPGSLGVFDASAPRNDGDVSGRSNDDGGAIRDGDVDGGFDGGAGGRSGTAADAGGAADAGNVAGSSGAAGAGGAGGAAGASEAGASGAATAGAGGSCEPAQGAREVLLLFDQSASMGEAWGERPKLNGALDAVRAAAAAAPDSLKIGTLFFPTQVCIPLVEPPAGGAVAAIDASPQIGFRAPAQFLTAWDAKWMGTWEMPIGSPVQEAFDRAHAALSAVADPAPRRAVVIITDGEGNCFPTEASGASSTRPELRAAAWAAEGIVTHAVVLPSNGALSSTEPAAIAEAGGSELIVPSDEAALESALRGIFGVASSCP